MAVVTVQVLKAALGSGLAKQSATGTRFHQLHRVQRLSLRRSDLLGQRAWGVAMGAGGMVAQGKQPLQMQAAMTARCFSTATTALRRRVYTGIRM